MKEVSHTPTLTESAKDAQFHFECQMLLFLLLFSRHGFFFFFFCTFDTCEWIRALPDYHDKAFLRIILSSCQKRI